MVCIAALGTAPVLSIALTSSPAVAQFIGRILFATVIYFSPKIIYSSILQ
jgi:hypothetical protein